MEKDWHLLTPTEQKPYIKKAEYLIDRGYVELKTVEQIAKQIYEKEG